MATTSAVTCRRDNPPGRNGHAHKSRVLVIDDVRDTADSMRMLLELFGHEVGVAYTGTEAIALAKQFRPDVVLCDIGMPDVCGYDVALALRGDPATAGIRLIAMTGFTSEAVRGRCRAAGFERHMAKPVDADELLVVLAACSAEAAPSHLTHKARMSIGA